MNPFTPPIVWTRELEPSGDREDLAGRDRLWGTVTIAGIDHHVNAELVEEVDGAQQPVSEHTFVDHIHEIGGEGRNQTVEIDGRPYLLVITPFND